MTKVMVSCPGSCGELFQGLVGEQEVLLSYGIEKRSRVRLDGASSLARQAQGEKVRRALERLSPMLSLLCKSLTCLSARAILAAQQIWLAACRQPLWGRSSL